MKLLILMTLFTAAIATPGSAGAAPEPEIARTASTTSVEAGDVVTLTITPEGVGGFYAVKEELGDLSLVDHTADNLEDGAFVMLQSRTFTYDVKIPESALPGAEFSITGQWWTDPGDKQAVVPTYTLLEVESATVPTATPFMKIHRDSEDYSGTSTWDGEGEDGATGVVVGIDRLVDGDGNSVSGSITDYAAELHYDGTCLNVLELRNGRDFTLSNSNVDAAAGLAQFDGANQTRDEPHSIMAFAGLRLVGDVNQTCTLEVKFTGLADVDGNAISIDAAPPIAEFRRGNARQDDRVSIADALFGAQYLADLRDGCVDITAPGETAAGNADTTCMNPVNLAGVKTDGTTDRASIADVLFIAQHLADLRNETFDILTD